MVRRGLRADYKPESSWLIDDETNAGFSIRKACALTLNIAKLLEGNMKTVPDLCYTCPYQGVTGLMKGRTSTPCSAMSVILYKVAWVIDALPVIAWHRGGADPAKTPDMEMMRHRVLREKLASQVLKVLTSADKHLDYLNDSKATGSKPELPFVKRGGGPCEEVPLALNGIVPAGALIMRPDAHCTDSSASSDCKKADALWHALWRPLPLYLPSVKGELSSYFGHMRTFSIISDLEEKCQLRKNVIEAWFHEKHLAEDEDLKVCRVMADPRLSLAYLAFRLLKPEKTPSCTIL